MTREEYLRSKEDNERQIAYWEARTAESEKIAIELATCVEAVRQVATLWSQSDLVDRQGMAQSLFEYVIFDLETERIIDFRLKAWADRFIIAQAALYEDESKTPLENFQEVYTNLVPTGLELLRLSLHEIIDWLLIAGGIRGSAKLPSKNELIRLRFAAGESLSDLARAFNISPQRVYQIVNFDGAS